MRSGGGIKKHKRWKVGDRLKSDYGYEVIVQMGNDGKLEGKLICSPGHPCEHIPYSLNGKYVLMEEVLNEI